MNTRSLGVRRALVAFVAAAAVAGSGCIYIMAPPGAAVPAPSQPPPPAVGTQQSTLGLGVGVGVLSASDMWLTGGLYVGGSLALRLNEFMAVELAAGTATLTDDGWGGELAVSPATATVVFSMPDPYVPDQSVRWRFGVGAGTAGLSHTDYEVEPVGVFVLQAGGELVLPATGGTGGGRIFAVMDAMIGEDQVWDDTNTVWWDLGAMTTFRVGMEFGF